MEAGYLDRQIVIQSFTTAKNNVGEDVKTYSTFHSCWAMLAYKGGKENYEADKETATNTVDFVIRWKSGINEGMRIVYDSNDYDIQHIEEMGRRKYLKLKAYKKY